MAITPRRWWQRGLLLGLAGFLGLQLMAARPVVRAEEPHFNPPKQYYLALGDSLAFGYQEAKFQQELSTGTYDPATFTGYVDDFAALLEGVRPQLQLTNLSCPGETTTTFRAGGCSFRTAAPLLPLHAAYPITESQLAAALAFLAHHPGQVSPITLDIGANDLLDLFHACSGNAACVQTGLPMVLGMVSANLDAILTALRGASPSSEIIVLLPYDPYVASLAASVPAVQALDATIAESAAVHGVRVADGFPPFTAATICQYTFVCSPPLFDIHPTAAGYTVLAEVVWEASGYARLQQQ